MSEITLIKAGRKGFTLAEVLVTLTVIGVIAAIVITSLIPKTQDAEFKAAFKKEYSDIEQATKRLVMDNAGSLAGSYADPDGGGPLTINDGLRDKYLQYLSSVKKCDDVDTTDTDFIITNSNCWSKYTYLLNRNLGTMPLDSSQAILSNGFLLDFYNLNNTCNQMGSLYVCGQITIDVNGFKGPNQFGRDIFGILITKNRSLPSGTKGDTAQGYCNPTSEDFAGSGFGCAVNVLKNQDY